MSSEIDELLDGFIFDAIHMGSALSLPPDESEYERVVKSYADFGARRLRSLLARRALTQFLGERGTAPQFRWIDFFHAPFGWSTGAKISDFIAHKRNNKVPHYKTNGKIIDLSFSWYQEKAFSFTPKIFRESSSPTFFLLTTDTKETPSTNRQIRVACVRDLVYGALELLLERNIDFPAFGAEDLGGDFLHLLDEIARNVRRLPFLQESIANIERALGVKVEPAEIDGVLRYFVISAVFEYDAMSKGRSYYYYYLPAMAGKNRNEYGFISGAAVGFCGYHPLPLSRLLVLNYLSASFTHYVHLAEIERHIRREASASAYGRIAATLKHDLKGTIGGLETHALSARRWLQSGNLKETTDSLNAAVDQINLAKFHLTKFESGDLTLKIEEVDLHNALSPALAYATEQDIRIESDVESCKVWADSLRLQAVFAELVRNAIFWLGKTKRGKKITIRASLAREDLPHQLEKGCQYFRVTFQDNGPGVCLRDKSRIFERGYSGRREEGGEGLGLFGVRRDVEIFGGYIREVGQRGKGAIFEIFMKSTQEQSVALTDGAQRRDYAERIAS